MRGDGPSRLRERRGRPRRRHPRFTSAKVKAAIQAKGVTLISHLDLPKE